VDTRFRLNPNWIAMLQAAASATRAAGGVAESGSAYYAELRREGRHFTQSTQYWTSAPRSRLRQASSTGPTSAASPGVHVPLAAEGEVPLRLGAFRRSRRDLGSRWHPPRLGTRRAGELGVQSADQVGLSYKPGRERLRPVDFAGLPGSMDFATRSHGVSFSSQYLSQLTFNGAFTSGRAINLVPPRGETPALARSVEASLVSRRGRTGTC